MKKLHLPLNQGSHTMWWKLCKGKSYELLEGLNHPLSFSSESFRNLNRVDSDAM